MRPAKALPGSGTGTAASATAMLDALRAVQGPIGTGPLLHAAAEAFLMPT